MCAVTCGMMVSFERRSCRPISAIFTWSMVISPAAASSSLNRQSVMEDFPAPVRPTMPICTEQGHMNLISFWPASDSSVIPPHNTSDLLSSFDTQCQVLQHQVQSVSVPDAVVLELHATLHWPLRRWLLVLHLPGGL